MEAFDYKKPIEAKRQPAIKVLPEKGVEITQHQQLFR